MIVKPMNPVESELVFKADGPEGEGGDGEERLDWGTVWTALFRRLGVCPGSGTVAFGASPRTSSDNGGSRNAKAPRRSRLRGEPCHQSRSEARCCCPY